MAFAETLMALRKQRGLSQEELGSQVDVSRQTVSKWELGSTTPELDKLVALGDYFGVTLDQLVGRDAGTPAAPTVPEPVVSRSGWHYKSKRTLWGLPLVHINFQRWGAARAKGIVAIGNVATGLVAVGGVAAGLISFGGVALGLIALGAVGVGLLLAAAGVAVGGIALGGVALGYLAFGGVAAGVYAVGGVASAVKVAVGEYTDAPYMINPSVYRTMALDVPQEQRTEWLLAWQQGHVCQIFLQFPRTPQWIVRLLAYLGTH